MRSEHSPMRIALVSSAAPLIQGGARLIVEWLGQKLIERGHKVESIFIPTADEPETVLQEMATFRMLELDQGYDLAICFRPPAHMIRHRRKVCWFIHHIRQFYDLWDTEFRGLPDTAQTRAIRHAVIAADTAGLSEARTIFTNSRTVSDRLARFNGLASEVLYPPLFDPGGFRFETIGDEIVSVARLEQHKRQHLLVGALAHTRTEVRLRIAGRASDPAYVRELEALATRLGVASRVTIEDRWIDESEKIELLSRCLAAAYIPLDEDSYGYPTLEAAHARKATVSTDDSGGVLEFVEHRRSGLIAAPTPESLAACFDELASDRARAESLGNAALMRIDELRIDWDTTIARLLG